MIIDDDAVDRLTVRRMLGRSALREATVQEVGDPQSALRELDREGDLHTDCIILDFQLGGYSGVDVLRDLRARHPEIPVIVLTGQRDPQAAAAMLKAGALDFLGKDGLTPERLEQAIRGAIRVARAEHEALEVRERLAATLRSIADAVLTVDRGGKLVYLNEAAESLTGWPSLEAIGRDLDEIAPARVPEGASGADETLDARVDAVLKGAREKERADMLFTTRQGRHIYVEVSVAAMRDAAADVSGAVIALRDITARRAAESQLAGVNERLKSQANTLEQVNEQLVSLNRVAESARQEADRARADVEAINEVGSTLASELSHETIVQKVTDAATSLTGAKFGAFFYNVVDAQGEKLTLYTLSGAPRAAFEDFGHPRATPVFAPTFHGTGIVRSDDITRDPRYGKMAPHHGMPPRHLPVKSYLAVPVFARSGEVLGGLFFGHSDVGVFTDRSERLVNSIAALAGIAIEKARLYDAEKRARASAEAANRAKAEFLANMSHELRTPLNAIGGYADLLVAGIRGTITDEQRADLDRIKRNQHHLLSLINDILNFAKIEAGRVQMKPRDVAMAESLAQLESLIGPQLLEKRLRYEYKGCDNTLTAHVDPERMQQILLNLLSNAVKFTPEGGAITVECSASDDVVTVSVLDTGVGIPSDKLESIFEPFVQLDRARWSGVVGTGLGLAISRDLARAMGGDLTAASEVDVGSNFLLRLPRREGVNVRQLLNTR